MSDITKIWPRRLSIQTDDLDYIDWCENPQLSLLVQAADHAFSGEAGGLDHAEGGFLVIGREVDGDLTEVHTSVPSGRDLIQVIEREIAALTVVARLSAGRSMTDLEDIARTFGDNMAALFANPDRPMLMTTLTTIAAAVGVPIGELLSADFDVRTAPGRPRLVAVGGPQEGRLKA